MICLSKPRTGGGGGLGERVDVTPNLVIFGNNTSSFY